MTRRVYVRVTDRVQGGACRGSAQRAALAEGLGGWVRNCDDGAVEGEAEGPADTVDRFLAWCRIGPPAARVRAVEVQERKPVGVGRSFEITS